MDRRKNLWRGIWVNLNSGEGDAIFARGMGRWNRLEGLEFQMEPLPGTRNHQDVNNTQRGVVGGNDDDRGSIPAKVGFWVGLRMFSYMRTPTKLTNTISKTQLLGPKKVGFLPKTPECGPFLYLACFSSF